MSVFDKISSKIDISLNLTISSQIVLFLKSYFSNERDLLVAVTSITVLLSIAGDETVMKTKNKVLMDFLSVMTIIRRISIIIFSDLVIDQAKPRYFLTIFLIAK